MMSHVSTVVLRIEGGLESLAKSLRLLDAIKACKYGGIRKRILMASHEELQVV